MWWPEQADDQQYREEVPEVNFTFQDVTDAGVGLWGRMTGQCNSSTRMELAGSIVAMVRRVPLRIAADSKSMIDKAMKLKQAATQLVNDPESVWWPRKNPMGKPWSLQPDGDLWKILWDGLLTRGPESVTWQKVKRACNS